MIPKSTKIVTDHDKLPIQPRHIDTAEHFFNSFGKMESEHSARLLVCMAQQKGGWFPFTMEEIRAFAASVTSKLFYFNGLDDSNKGWLVYRDNRYYFTVEFIARCFMASPAYQPSVELFEGSDEKVALKFVSGK